VNREKQAALSMGKEDTVGEVGLDKTELFSSHHRSIRLLEKRFEPQTTNAQHPFVPSIFAVNLLSLSVMNTAGSQVQTPPQSQKDGEKPAIEMIAVGETTAFNLASSAFLILERRLNFHPFGILSHSLMRCLLV
jgi:hypothetical protein